MADPIVDIAPDQIYRSSQEYEQNNSQQEVGKEEGGKLDKSYLRFNAIGTALGFLVNGYMYQVGAILLTLYVDVYHTVNDSSFLQSALSTSVLYGVLFGLIIFGFIADMVGRKAGLIMCSSLVILGSVISVAANGATTDGMFWMIIVGRAVVGLGMGGEYTCNVPNVMEDSEDVSRKNRGRRVSLLVMFMEVVGNNTPSVLQLILVAAACRNVFIDTSSKTGVVLPNCHPQVVWRLSYGLGLIPCVIVLAIRVRMRDSAMFEADARLRKKSYDLLDLYVIFRHFSSRMMGTVFMWFFIDWINYSQGNFGGVILSSIIGASLFKIAWIGLAQGVVLQTGPLVSSLVVDRLGRRRTEMLGWFWLASTQLITAGVYLQLAKHAVGYVIWTTFVFIFQYFVFIPVYLVPAEVYPTRIRATMYGWSSALGKVGGIVGTTVFPYMWRGFSPDHSEIGHSGLIGLRRVQWFYAGLEYLGFIFAVLFVPEYSNVGLRGEDKRYLELRTRYAARLAKKYGVVPADANDQEVTRLGRFSVWNLIGRKLSGSPESYEHAKMEYIRMLLSRCSLETSEQVEYYANAPIYYDDRTLISHWFRRWTMGKEAAEEYIRQAHLLGETEDNAFPETTDSDKLKDEAVLSKEGPSGTSMDASHAILEDKK